jgi:hypothetical protein
MPWANARARQSIRHLKNMERPGKYGCLLTAGSENVAYMHKLLSK